MEGVPRIPMMSFPMRRSADTPHFKSRLKSFISNHYNEDADSYSNEIHELESLRASSVHVSKDYAGCSTLKKYFCQLNFLKSRFPMNEGGTCAVSFSWYDVFSDNVHGWSDVDFEMSCVLFNIGALHSELGALDNRQTAEGMKTSCTHFQCAAGAFSHLRHNYQKYFTPDVSPDMLNILNNVCLAQAQECILEKSLIDNRKSTITAKVALQIVEYYSTALRIIDGMLKDAAQYSDKLIKAVKKWRKLVEMKVHYYGCIAYLYRGMQAEDQGKWGERVTMYKAALEKLAECQKLGKNMEKTDPIHDTIHFTLDVVGGKVSIAEKENEFIYHEKVPELEAVMSDVKAVSLVKGIQFKCDDPQVAGPDIFGRLVPMEAHEASSLYSEEKAKILRTYSRRIEEKNEALDRFILPLQLDQLELHDSGNKVPQELMDCCAALSVNKDAVKRLSDLMAQLSSLFHDVEANLEEIQDHLQDQEKKEKEYQEVVGKRPPNNIIMEITKEFQKYQSAQGVAAESNKTLHEAMVLHVTNLAILMKPLPQVMLQIPTFDALEKNVGALERMKKLAGKVGEMRKQREMLESQLRDSIMNDDITKSLVVKKDEDLETVFREELQKHDKITQLLDQNLLAQENIIRALTEANAEYAETRKATVELKRKRDNAIQQFINSYEAYDELTSKCNKGIEFYTKLSGNVEKLLQRMRSVCKVQNEERDINMERIIRKAQNPPPGVGMGVGGNINIAGMVPPAGHGMGYGNNLNMMNPGTGGAVPGQVPGQFYPPVTGASTYPNTPTASMNMPKPSTGGHLKLKDYLAMKKEGPTAAEMAAKMNMNNMGPGTGMGIGGNNAGIPTQQQQQNLQHQQGQGGIQGYDPTGTGGMAQQQVQHPMVSSTPPPQANPIGVRPAPVGSEDVGKDSAACSYGYQAGPQQAPYNNFGYYGNQPVVPSSGVAQPLQQQQHLPQAQPQQQAVPPVPPVSGYYTQQQPRSQPQAPSAPTPQVYSTAAPVPVPQQYPHSQTAPAASYPQQQQSQAYQNQPHQYPPQISQAPVPAPSPLPQPVMTSYTPNQTGYSPGGPMNTSYASPVYSRQYQYDGKTNDMSSAYSVSYGVPLSSSGMTGTYHNTYSSPAQYPSTVSTGTAPPLPSTTTQAKLPSNNVGNPPSAPPANQNQNENQPMHNPNPAAQAQTSYYSAVYHPTANTVTNATYSTGTTATPQAQVQAPQAPQETVPPQSQPAPAPTPPVQQQQSLPAPNTDNVDYSQTSFLAQYVRQNQGYLSSKPNAPQGGIGMATFPSSVNYNADISTYSQPQQPQQNPGQGYISSGQAQGQYVQQQPTQPQQTPAGQYPTYPTQQWQQQPQQPTVEQQVPPQNQNHQAQGTYPTGQYPPQPPQQQQYQQYNPNPAPAQAQAPGNYQAYQQQPQQQQQQAYQPSQAYQNQNAPAQAPYQNQSQNQNQGHPPQPPAIPKQSSTNLDLLSDIDFNAMPAVQPLAPSPAHSASPNQNQDKECDHVLTTISPAKSVSSSIASYSTSTSSFPSVTPELNLNRNQSENQIQEETMTINKTVVTGATATGNVQAGEGVEIAGVTGENTKSLVIATGSPLASLQNGGGVGGVKSSKVCVVTGSDPFLDSVALDKFTLEVERFEKTVEGLAKKSLNGPATKLDLKWKDLLDIQNATSVKRSISVARCYPMKNRFPDIMPYDQTRVPIPDTKDDYINASFVNGLSANSYPLIATQAPLPSTMADFWHMIWQHNVELVVCLSSDIDLKEHVYWPKEKATPLEFGVLRIILQTKNIKNHYVERILSVIHRDLKQSRVVVHLQFTGWTGNTFPVSPGPLVSFVKECTVYYLQQRNRSRPVVVHCLSGVGKTGVFSVLSSSIREIDLGHGIPDIVQIAGVASEHRKGIMNDKEYLRFAYHSLLYYCQDILMKRGILSASSRPNFEEKPKKSHIRHPSQDFLQDFSLAKLVGEHPFIITSTTSTPNSPVHFIHSNSNTNSNSSNSSPSNSSKSSISRQQRSSSLVGDKPKLSYHDVPDSLTNIEPDTFQMKRSNPAVDVDNEPTLENKKQAFEMNKGALFERKEDEDSKDPLSSLDPLWTMKT